MFSSCLLFDKMEFCYDCASHTVLSPTSVKYKVIGKSEKVPHFYFTLRQQCNLIYLFFTVRLINAVEIWAAYMV